MSKLKHVVPGEQLAVQHFPEEIVDQLSVPDMDTLELVQGLDTAHRDDWNDAVVVGKTLLCEERAKGGIHAFTLRLRLLLGRRGYNRKMLSRWQRSGMVPQPRSGDPRFLQVPASRHRSYTVLVIAHLAWSRFQRRL
jgi:hypothetical protein